MSADDHQNEEPPPPLQFRLRTIFVLTTVAALVAAAATGVFGFFVAEALWGVLALCAVFLAYVIFVLALVLTARALVSTRRPSGDEPPKHNQPRD
jgi:membrane protein YdbS with pleckstrin-like domain